MKGATWFWTWWTLERNILIFLTIIECLKLQHWELLEVEAMKTRRKRGRNKRLSPRFTESLLKVVDDLRFKSVSEIASTFSQLAPTSVSIRTVRRTLKENRIQNYTAIRKPCLSPKNMKACLRWSNVHKEWDNDQWNKFVFCEESWFIEFHNSSWYSEMIEKSE